MKKRYLVHLHCSQQAGGHLQYHSLISLEDNLNAEVGIIARESTFASEFDLVETLTAVLPLGSMINNIISLVKTKDGYDFYPMLTDKEAELFGWKATS